MLVFSKQCFIILISDQTYYIMDSRTHSSIQRQRSFKHHKLIYYIDQYRQTNQQKKKLQKIKNNTMMQINLRYLRSQVNRHYKFPKNEETSQSQQPQPVQCFSKEPVLYDLRSQNQPIQKKLIISHSIQLDSKKRVKSLQKEKNDVQYSKYRRINELSKDRSLKKLRRTSIIVQKHHKSNIKLPGIKKEYLHTETRQDPQIQEIIGKKLMTQVSSPKMVQKKRGLDKYVQNMKEELDKKKKVPRIHTKHFF